MKAGSDNDQDKEIQGGLFNCPSPKISKYKKNLEYPDCPPLKISKCQTGKENSNT